MGSNLHSSPEVNNARNYASVSNINKCSAVTRGCRQVYTVERVEYIPLEVKVGLFRDGKGLGQRQIHFTVARAQQAVASGIPEGVLRRRAIGTLVVPVQNRPHLSRGLTSWVGRHRPCFEGIANEVRSIVNRRIQVLRGG